MRTFLIGVITIAALAVSTPFASAKHGWGTITTAKRIGTNAMRSTVGAIITDGTSAAETHTVTGKDLAHHGAFFNDLPRNGMESKPERLRKKSKT